MRMPGPHNCYDEHKTCDCIGDPGCVHRNRPAGWNLCPGGRPPTVPEMVAWLQEQGAATPIPWCATHDRMMVSGVLEHIGCFAPSGDGLVCQLEDQRVYRIEANNG